MDSGDWIVINNAKKDPAYCPYCMRCSGLARMRRVESFYWKHSCGAECDLRNEALNFSDEGSKVNPDAN